MRFPQVRRVMCQTGRPDDGTDVAGFYNNEFDVALYPEEEWKPKISKEELIDTMNKALSTSSRAWITIFPSRSWTTSKKPYRA